MKNGQIISRSINTVKLNIYRLDCMTFTSRNYKSFMQFIIFTFFTAIINLICRNYDSPDKHKAY